MAQPTPLSNVHTMSAALTRRHLEAHVDEITSEIITMVALRKRAQDITEVGNGFRDIGAQMIADKLFEAALAVHDAVIMMATDVDEKIFVAKTERDQNDKFDHTNTA